MRVEVRRYAQTDGYGLWHIYRVCEVGGPPVTCWLPGLEPHDPLGALDRNGFSERTNARAFAAGVNWIRAEAGLIPGVTTQDIDRERATLDGTRPLPELDDLDLDEDSPRREAAQEPRTGPPLFGWTAA